jgi:hypothetical protein
MLLEEGANAADGAASATRRAADVIFIVFYMCVLFIDCFVLLSCTGCCVVEDLFSRMLWKAMLCQKKNNEWKQLLRFQVEEDRVEEYVGIGTRNCANPNRKHKLL